MYKQIIIARKDLNMSPGKLAAQVSHGSMAFLTSQIRKNTQISVVGNISCIRAYCVKYDAGTGEKIIDPVLYRRDDLTQWAQEFTEKGKSHFYVKPVNPDAPYGVLELCEPEYEYVTKLIFKQGLYDNWLNESFTKVVLTAKNRAHLLKAKTMADELGLRENEDYFCIYDACRTELEAEEVDENGVGRTLTCIGFTPMDSEFIDQIGKKYQLYQ